MSHDIHDIKALVRQGYDTISYAYRSDHEENEFYTSWLTELIPLLQPGAAVLDLGCGCGIPATKILAEHFRVTGVDLSPVQIQRARSLVPSADFHCADMATIDFPVRSFDAVVSLYAIIHLPLEEQPTLFRKIRNWLRPGGYFMAIVGHTAWTGTDSNWLLPGAEMYWSHTDSTTYAKWLQDSGFSILWQRFIPEGDGGHTLMLVQTNENDG